MRKNKRLDRWKVKTSQIHDARLHEFTRYSQREYGMTSHFRFLEAGIMVFEIFCDASTTRGSATADIHWRWRLIGTASQVLAKGGSIYSSQQECLDAIAQILDSSQQKKIMDHVANRSWLFDETSSEWVEVPLPPT